MVCDADGSIRAFERVLRASGQIGGRGIPLHVASPAARALQLPHGFGALTARSLHPDRGTLGAAGSAAELRGADLAQACGSQAGIRRH